MYGYKDKKFFNTKTGAVVISVTEGKDLGDDWKNMTDNQSWYPLYDIDGNYLGYNTGRGFVEVKQKKQEAQNVTKNETDSRRKSRKRLSSKALRK